MKKKIICLVMALSALMSPIYVKAEDNVKVVVDGEQVVFEDQGPVIIDERTLVPIRAVMEKLGKKVDWNGELQQAIVYDEYITVKLTLNSAVMVNEVKDPITGEVFAFDTELDVAPQLINERTCLPIRAVVEAFGIAVDWDQETQSVLILSDALLC
ncbi:MAG: copper amine oxidase N-terminal domain-containing protein [Clostridia bacterium]|nr:copper amine oxidase N-terminal domain-containing protein [Clostridia bacterium]